MLRRVGIAHPVVERGNPFLIKLGLLNSRRRANVTRADDLRLCDTPRLIVFELPEPLLGFPAKQGLYDPEFEKDSCGVGFVAHIKGERSHQIVLDADQVLRNMNHRGACGCEANTGDGAGILVQIPHKFFAKKTKQLGFELPAPGEYAIGYLFLPREPQWRQVIIDIYAEAIAEEGMKLLGWRDVPTDNSSLGESVKPTVMPGTNSMSSRPTAALVALAM